MLCIPREARKLHYNIAGSSHAVAEEPDKGRLDWIAILIRRCVVNGWYESSVAVLKVVGLLAFVGATARGLVAFGRWRTAFRNRMVGLDAREEEVS